MVHYWGDDAVGKQARTGAGVQTKPRYNPVVFGDIDRLYIKMMADTNCVRVYNYGRLGSCMRVK